MESKIRCDIVIPTYNGSSHLPRILRSIADQSFQNFDCYVIDDNSTDNACEVVARDFPRVHLLKQPENMGPSHNRNIAIQAGNSPYIVIFDDDTYLDDLEWVDKAISFMEENPDVGQLAAMIVNGFDQEILLDCGIVKNWYLFGGIFHNVHVGDTQGKHEQGRIVLGACSAGTVLRRELYDKIEGFDAKYYYPVEDLDLSLRIHLAGYKVWYEPSLKVFHYESQAMGKSLSRKMYLYRRNCLLALTENFPITHVICMYLAILGKEVALPIFQYIGNLLTGKVRKALLLPARDYFGSFLFLTRHCLDIVNKRVSSNRYRKYPRRYLLQVNQNLKKDLSV